MHQSIPHVSLIVRVSNMIVAPNHNMKPISESSALSEADRFSDSINYSPDHALFHRYILCPFRLGRWFVGG
jgi:hypothetical protein